MTRFLVVFIFLSFFLKVCSQGWEHTFNADNRVSSFSIDEDYDGGVLITTIEYYLNQNNDIISISSLIKLDINGVVLWKKGLGKVDTDVRTGSLLVLEDGSTILGGADLYQKPNLGSYVLKLNECRELEWTKRIGNNKNDDYVTEILELSDGNILLQASYLGDARVTLFKIDLEGNILWQKDYFEPVGIDSEFGAYNALWLVSMEETADAGFILCGHVATPKASTNTIHASRTFLMKTDEYGEREWIYIYGYNTDTVKTQSPYILEQEDGYIIHCSLRVSNQNVIGKSHLFKIDKLGNFMWDKTIGDTIVNTHSKGLVQVKDKWYLMCDVEKGNLISDPENYESYIKVYKTDTLGNILDVEDFGKDTAFTSVSLDISLTKENFMLIAGYQRKDKHVAYALQIDTNLNIVQYKDTTLAYDYLCDHEITNGYIPFDTALSIVNIEGEAIEILRYPNPAAEYINFEIKDFENFRYNLSIFDFRGKQVFEEQNIEEKTRRVETSHLSNSIYFYTLDFGHGNVAKGSFIKE